MSGNGGLNYNLKSNENGGNEKEDEDEGQRGPGVHQGKSGDVRGLAVGRGDQHRGDLCQKGGVEDVWGSEEGPTKEAAKGGTAPPDREGLQGHSEQAGEGAPLTIKRGEVLSDTDRKQLNALRDKDRYINQWRKRRLEALKEAVPKKDDAPPEEEIVIDEAEEPISNKKTDS